MELRGHASDDRGVRRGDRPAAVYAARVHDPAIRDGLREHDWRVTTVRHHAQALEAVECEEPDCVLAAPEAGEPDAIGLCAALRERDVDVPFLLLDDGPLGERADAALAADVSRRLDPDDAGAVVDAAREAAAAYRERVAEREALERDGRMLDALLSSLPLSIYFKDERHRHERVSDAMICATDPDLYLENDEGKAHQHPEDLLGKTDFDIFGPDVEDAIEDDRRVMETGEAIVDKVERSETRLGDEAWYSTTKAPRYDEDGEVAGVVGVTLDITDRMRYRRDLEQQNERLEEFASMLSHDLRSPVTVAQGYVELLESQGYDEDAVDAAGEALERIEELIEEILTFARQGQAVVDPDVVDLERVARDAWDAVETRDATLSVDVDLPVRADPARLQRALENLFRNAVDHAGPDVAVRVADRGTDFCVADDGPGVPAGRREEVFERGVTTDDDGTGFGLATVAAIADAHGWDVRLEESDHGGACFVFAGVARSDVH